MKFLKNRTFQIVAGIVLLIAIFLGGYFFVANRAAKQVEEEDPNLEQVIEKLDPESIGLEIEANPSKKAVKFTIANASGMESLEYQLTYEADSTAQEQSEGGEARVQRGITGEEMVQGESSYESPWLDLGSCSRNVCRYDTGVDSVTLTLKITKSDGKIYEVEKSLEL